MKTKTFYLKSWLLMMLMLIGAGGNLWAQSYEQLTSIANIDEGAQYVLGIDNTGFHYDGTSSWGKCALPSTQTPLYYTLTKASDGKSFTAKAVLNNTTYYLQIPTSNTFSMAEKTGTNTDLIIGTTQVNGTNYAVANKTTTARHLRINGTSGLRSYAGTTGSMAFFYKVVTSSVIVNAPTFTPTAGEIGYGKTVTLSAEEGTTIYYTLDGSTPTNNSTQYTAPITMTSNITIKAIAYNGEGNKSSVSSAAYTIKLNLDPKNINSNYFVKVTNLSELENGDAVLIVNEESKKALSTNQKTSNRGDEAVTINGTVIDGISENVQKLVLVKDQDNYFYFSAGETGFLYASSSSSNELKTGTGNGDNAKALITFTNGNATIKFQGSNTRNWLRYNSGSSLFSCYASGQKDVQIYKEVERPTETQKDAEFAFSTTEFTVTNGTTFTAPNLTTAEGYDGTIQYTSSNTNVATVNVTTGAVTIVGVGTTTIKASAEATENFYADEASYTLTISRGDDDLGGKNNPYTVAQAREFIETLGTESSEVVFVKGIVSQVDSYNSNYKSITYWISDDGTTESQLECYSGMGLNSADFSSINDIQVGDIVTVAGTLRKYNDIYEFNYNNYLASFQRPVFNITPSVNISEGGHVEYANGVITAVLNPGYRFANPAYTIYAGTATVTQNGNQFTVKATSDCEIEINFEKIPEHNVVWSVNGTETTTTALEDAAVEFPATPADIEGKTFVGWVTETIDGETDEAPTFVTSATMGTEDQKYYAVFASQETEASQYEKTDDLTREFTGVEEKATYAEWSGKTATSSAVYAGQSAGDKNSIQLRSSNSNSGVISTTSGGKLAKVVVEWNSETASSRKLDIYGSNTAYEASTDLYDNSKQGTKLGSIVNGTSTELPITGDYQYIGLRSNSGAMYLSKISITWEGGTPATYSGYCTTVIKPVAKIGNKGFATLQAAVDAAEAGQTIDIVNDFTLTTVTTSPSDKYNVNVNKSVTINGNGHVITSAQGKRALVLEGEGLDVTIKDLTIKSNKAEACLWIASNLTCTLDNTVLDGTNGKSYNQPLTIGSIDGEGRVTLNVTNGSVIKTNDTGTAHYAIIAWHPADITVTGSKLIGWANVYLKSAAAGSTVKIEGSEMKSQGLSGKTNSFSILVTEGNNNTIEVKDTKITSSAVEGTYQSLITLGGEGNVVKLLGKTTYETNDKNWGAITYSWGSLMNNKLYLDDTTKLAFAEYLDGSHQETIDPADETGLYPVSFEPEVLYYWAVEGGYDGGYYNFAEPFVEGWLDDDEFIALQKNITLTEDITCQLASGTSFNFLLGEFTADKNGHSVLLNTGVTVLTDKQTDIFKAAEAGYVIVETETETGYSYTAEKVMLAQPIIFHDGGEYEGELTVAIAGEGVKYTLNDGAEQAYTQPFTISETTTVKAWAEQDGVKSDVVEKTFTIVEAQKGPSVEDGYYTIKTNDGKYVNVAGRKTVTLVSDTESKAGTIIRVKATDGKVETLRSQGVDVPSYAKKAMNYVPEIVRLAVDKLHAEGAGELLGTTGYDKIMEKFNEAFDYNLYLEQDGGAYRIYGRTPSMKHVVDFYAENKANVDAKLPELEAFINKAIDKVLEKTGGRGQSILVDFNLHNVWQNMGSTLTEPTDEASTMKFYEEVLTSEANVWNFAYQTAMIYWGNLKDHPKFQENLDKLGDYSKYINKVENIRPDFKYYIVPSASGVDFISEGNVAIKDASTAWTMEAVSEFNAKFEVEQSHTVYSTQGGVQAEYKEYYTTLYTDFAYTLPEGVKAYKVTEITEKHGVAKREEMTGVIPAQTPVLLVSSNEGAQALTLTTEAGTAVTGNLLVGADALINEYQIKTPQVESLFNLAKDVLGDNAYENYLKKYEHLMMKNAGTVGNKYFFGLTEDDINQCTTLNDNGEEDCVIRSLSDGDEKVGFYGNWEAAANKGFLVTSDFNPVKLSLVGDVNRDGDISIADVTALVNIILGKATYPEDNDKYDFEAANVNGDESISIADVTALVNIILGK